MEPLDPPKPPPLPVPVKQTPVIKLENKIWSMTIPRINLIFLVLSCCVIGLIDIPILIGSPSLFVFFIPMVIALAALFIYYKIEKNLTEKYRYGNSSIDKFFLIMIVLRNIILFLNVIPMIQLIGIQAAIWITIPYIIFYKGSIKNRDKELKETQLKS